VYLDVNFRRHMPWVFYFNNSRREVIVRFVDIGRIVDHHCLEVVVCLVDITIVYDVPRK
jgi:hypothetical protein